MNMTLQCYKNEDSTLYQVIEVISEVYRLYLQKIYICFSLHFISPNIINATLYTL